MEQDDELKQQERLSALADGELSADEAAQLLALPQAESARLHATWHSYHLIGDVLRGGEQTAVHASSDFLSRLQGRLAAEAPLVPERPAELPVVVPIPAGERMAEPANDASFRWKMVAGCASFAAVAALAWSVVGGVTAPSAPQLAAAPAPAVASLAAAPSVVEQPVTLASGEAQVMLRDARLDELLAAHKQAGASTALQMPMPAGFLRSATFSAPER